MRDILFRGKAGPIWVAGYLLVWPSGQMEICAQTPGEEAQMDKMTVKPETVGQFTGLTDKNGKKIFEGDIVKAERICNGLYWTGCVVWWHGCFAIQGIKDSNNVPAIDLFRNYEVIGNIHDNSELCEV